MKKLGVKAWTNCLDKPDAQDKHKGLASLARPWTKNEILSEGILEALAILIWRYLNHSQHQHSISAPHFDAK